MSFARVARGATRYEPEGLDTVRGGATCGRRYLVTYPRLWCVAPSHKCHCLPPSCAPRPDRATWRSCSELRSAKERARTDAEPGRDLQQRVYRDVDLAALARPVVAAVHPDVSGEALLAVLAFSPG